MGLPYQLVEFLIFAAVVGWLTPVLWALVKLALMDEEVKP
jgi:hypothetical protein